MMSVYQFIRAIVCQNLCNDDQGRWTHCRTVIETKTVKAQADTDRVRLEQLKEDGNSMGDGKGIMLNGL